ncbi:ABC transporter substrate-binding protein [Methanocaldococcus infernus]
MKKLFVIFLSLFIVLATFLSGCTGTGESGEKVIKVGVLTDLSGDLSTDGRQINNILKIAKDNVEQYLKEKGLNYKVELYVEDTQTNPSLCLQKVQNLKAQGCNLIIGPLSSSELKNIKNFVMSNKLVIISPSSTAIPQLLGFASPKDKKYIFRIVPNDNFQGKAIAGELKDMGIKNVVVLYRDDAWGQGLASAAVTNMKKLGINVIAEIKYPSQPTPSDWSPYIQKLLDYTKGKDTKDTGILAIGFGELATLMSQIPDNSPLLNYKWFGSDGFAMNENILKVAKDKGEKVGFYSTVFYGKSKEAEKIVEEYRKRGYGEEVGQYALCAYDAFMLGVISYAEMLKEKGSYDPDLLSKLIKENAVKYSNGDFGFKPVTGYIEFNEWNDRATGDYGIYAITKDGWKLVGIWHYKDGKIEWL